MSGMGSTFVNVLEAHQETYVGFDWHGAKAGGPIPVVVLTAP